MLFVEEVCRSLLANVSVWNEIQDMVGFSGDLQLQSHHYSKHRNSII